MRRPRNQTGSKTIIIIAGPNGAGKTTFAHEFLPQEAGCPEFINVDWWTVGPSMTTLGPVPF